ncbi:MAG: SpoIIE family protein phosphatase [Capsulimonas sp.]|uniref:SpoIIE family protein phosphatase n=1 Tax=Capsulimonas sp. TaxID=2494211 RepID=UPI003264B0E2
MINTDQLSILIVEDNEDDFLIVRDLLRDADIERFVLEWVETYEDGLEAIRTHLHDLILLDFRLSNRTGLELLKETRSISSRPPVILMTGQGDHEIDMQVMQAGASDYLVKDHMDAAVLERAIRYAVERHNASKAFQCLLTQMKARAEREELINRVGQALLATTDSIAIQEQVAAMLGESLGVDRCYLMHWNPTQNKMLVITDYRRVDLPSVAGEYRASEYTAMMTALFSHGTAVVPDIRSSDLPDAVIAAMESFALRSVLAVPFFERERIVAVLWVAMAGAPRSWTPEEVALTETVSALTRTAVERERLAQREHNIATQLQAALTPAIPDRVSGLALTKYYEAALNEAMVGGDFYDVFPIENGCTALIVGDLSGKGLEAAAQVATVRNMLRYALYRSRTIVGAVKSLNSLLVEQELISGFATLFVGAYSSGKDGKGTLRYVNCGQEPALVRRAAGTVEQLAPTGAVLGSHENSVFEERVVTLLPGDALVMFTDGMTECGIARQEMLGIEGVAALLEPSFTPEETASADLIAEAAALRLIDGVEAASHGGVARDDICILVAVAEDNSSELRVHRRGAKSPPQAVVLNTAARRMSSFHKKY